MKKSDHRTRIAIVGSGPAGLMAATRLALSHQAPSLDIHLFEKRAGLGRKLLIAGSSGLNISHEHSLQDFSAHYEGWNPDFWKDLLTAFGPKDWIQFIEKKLGLETFLGTSQRYFVREMKASNLLKQWTTFLESHGVTIHPSHELSDFKSVPDSTAGNHSITLTFNQDSATEFTCDRAAFFLGGGSWEKETPPWVKLFESKGITLVPFEPSNVGYEVAWNEKFLKETEGKPLKKIELHTRRGSKMGELVITEYGIEGTPVYFCGTSGPATLDLKPDLSSSQILEKLTRVRENLSPMRRVKHHLGLCEASENLLFHHAPAAAKTELNQMVEIIKRFPLELRSPRPLMESISSKGGIALNEITQTFEMKKIPGIFCGGEMLDWDAPTGGFLIQACVSQGAAVAQSLLKTI
jgi:uncharacterized flavoprotein (TIGR03862 family)